MSLLKSREQLITLIKEYNTLKAQGGLDMSSEETMRTWLNDFLKIFGWDVRDTTQVLQEKVLSKEEKEKLKEIDSQNSRPDYTFKIGKQKLTFLDAKGINVNLKEDQSAAFQIKSYGWSILAPCAFISNFEEFAIYDCTYIPDATQPANLGRIYYKIDQYADNFETLYAHLFKDNVYRGHLSELYSSTLSDHPEIVKVTPDIAFAQQLSSFRLKLAANILKQNAQVVGTNSELLSYVVQVIINRILFIKVCEARKIENEGLLRSFKEAGFWSKFKESSYADFYEHYDGPLFDKNKIIHNLSIDDEVLASLLVFLYYPSPYRFDVIPTSLLSDIYEIFLSRKLLITPDGVEDKIKEEYIKTNGAVSTPQFMVMEVVRRTIDRNELSDSGVDGFFSYCVLDIACGSGVFAVAAYDYLEGILLEMHASGRADKIGEYFCKDGDQVLLTLLGRKAIIENCIFGVDIDPEAVEVAKMSLSLKVIDSAENLTVYNEIGIFGDKILNGVGNNIKCGNSLVEPDILEDFPELNDDEEELLKTNIFDIWGNEGFKNVFQHKKGFDAIIGNPPYVEVKNYNVGLPNMHKYLKNKYASSGSGKVDLAIPFIERASQLVNPKGRIGFVIQKRFFGTEYGKAIRGILSGGKLVSSIIDFRATDIFSGRMTYIALLILDKSAPSQFSYKFFTESVETLSSVLRESTPPYISLDGYTVMAANYLSEDAWRFGSPQLIEIRQKLGALGKLGDYAHLKVGIQVLWRKAYHVRPSKIEGETLVGNSDLEKGIKIEKAACRPLVCNERFHPFRSDAGDVYIPFPYEVRKGKVIEIPFATYKKRYPLAGAYLSRHKENILENVEHWKGDKWWHLYTRANNHDAVYPKIFVPMTALDTFASVTFSTEVYSDNANMFFIDIPTKDNTHIYALSAVINSTIFSVLARSIANPQAEGYFKFNKQFLEPVPFPVHKFSSDGKLCAALAACAIEIDVQQKKFESSTPRQKRTYEHTLRAEWEKLDRLCEDLYDLNLEERAFFRLMGRNIDRVAMLNL
jgi:type I restriction-modification system DNA methylase subunit